MKKEYGGVIWTDHALQRMGERGIKQGDAWAAFSRPHSSKKASIKDARVYYKTFGDTKIQVVAKRSEDKWIILSVWSKKAEKEIAKKSGWIFSLVKKLLKRKTV